MRHIISILILLSILVFFSDGNAARVDADKLFIQDGTVYFIKGDEIICRTALEGIKIIVFEKGEDT